MANTTSTRQEEVRPACAILWIRDIDAKHPAAPSWLGGQRFEEQEDIVKERAARDRLVLRECDLYLTEEHAPTTWCIRIAEMLEDLERSPARRVYISSTVLASANPRQLMQLRAALEAVGTELILCET